MDGITLTVTKTSTILVTAEVTVTVTGVTSNVPSHYIRARPQHEVHWERFDPSSAASASSLVSVLYFLASFLYSLGILDLRYTLRLCTKAFPHRWFRKRKSESPPIDGIQDVAPSPSLNFSDPVIQHRLLKCLPVSSKQVMLIPCGRTNITGDFIATYRGLYQLKNSLPRQIVNKALTVLVSIILFPTLDQFG